MTTHERLTDEEAEELDDYLNEFGLCCGDTNLVIAFLRDILGARIKPETEYDHKMFPPGHFVSRSSMIQMCGGNETFYWVLMYQLDRCKWVQHGSLLPGWITDKGLRVHELLMKWDPTDART